jgi:hypothetical protein
MSPDRHLTNTSISVPAKLLQSAKTQAALSFRTFSQYVSYLIDQDLNRSNGGLSIMKDVEHQAPGNSVRQQ